MSEDQGLANADAEAGVRPVVLDEIDLPMGATGAGIDGLNRVLDVSVAITARIGCVRKTISEILELGPGSVLDLERGANEPVDLVIGDKLIARGEIVVVGDRYGVRITEVIQGT